MEIPITSNYNPMQQDFLAQPKAQSSTPKEVFRNTDILISHKTLKEDNNTYTGTFFVSNNCSEHLTNVKLNFMVVKNVNLKVLGTSGYSLEPKQYLGIKKDYTMINTEPQKKIVMKIKFSYTIGSNEVADTITLEDF